MRSSFERCCHVLGLPADLASGQTLLRDAPPVQAIRQWLRGRLLEQRWLVVVDNADDLSWDVSGIVLSGRAGSVIITSTDSRASDLLGRGSETIKVDKIKLDKGISLLLNAIGKESGVRRNTLAVPLEEVANCLDMLPFAIDLAGA